MQLAAASAGAFPLPYLEQCEEEEIFLILDVVNEMNSPD